MSKYIKYISENYKKENIVNNDLDKYIDNLKNANSKIIDDIKIDDKTLRDKVGTVKDYTYEGERFDYYTNLPITIDRVYDEEVVYFSNVGRAMITYDKNTIVYRFDNYFDTELINMNLDYDFIFIFIFNDGGNRNGNEYTDTVTIHGITDIDRAKNITYKILRNITQHFIVSIDNVLLQTDADEVILNIKSLRTTGRHGYLNLKNVNPLPRYDIDKNFTTRDDKYQAKYYDVMEENKKIVNFKKSYVNTIKSKTKHLENKKRLLKESAIIYLSFSNEDENLKDLYDNLFNDYGIVDITSCCKDSYDLFYTLDDGYPEIIEDIVDVGNDYIKTNDIKFDKKIYYDIKDYILDKCMGMERYKVFRNVGNEFSVSYDTIDSIYNSILEDKKFELGKDNRGREIKTVNGKPLNALNNPDDNARLKSIVKKYRHLMPKILNSYDETTYDITLDGGYITITADDGTVLVNDKLDDEYTKDKLVYNGQIKENRKNYKVVIDRNYTSIFEDLNYEIGGKDGSGEIITVNGKKINVYDNPHEYGIIKGIRKKYKDIFGKLSKDYDESTYDVSINGGVLVITSDDGNVLLNKKLGDEFTKDDLEKMGINNEFDKKYNLKILKNESRFFEDLKYEVGQKNGKENVITVNGRKINAYDDPHEYEIIKGIHKKYKDIFKKFGLDYNEDSYDIVINGGRIIITSDEGEELVNEKLNDNLIKQHLIEIGVIKEGIKKQKFKTGDKVQYKVGENDNYTDDDGNIIVKPGKYIYGKVIKINKDDNVTVKWDISKLGEENFNTGSLSFKESYMRIRYNESTDSVFEELKDEILEYAKTKGLILTDEEKEEMDVEDDVDIKYFTEEEYNKNKKYSREDLEEEKDFSGTTVKFSMFMDASGNDYIGFMILDSSI